MKPATTKSSHKTAVVRKKRDLNNVALKKYFGKDSTDIWEKDIKTGEGSFDA
jgi:hypothetical protein